MLKDQREKTLEAGCVVVVTPQPMQVPGVVYEVSAPMVRVTPQGQIMAQELRVMVDFRLIVPVGANVPVAMTDEADSESAKVYLHQIREALSKIKPGATGGSLIMQ